MNKSLVRRGVEIGVFSAVIVVAMRALAGCAGAEFGDLDDFRGIACVVKPDAAKPLVVFALVVEVRIVVLAHGRFRRRIGYGRLRAGHENPLF